VARKNHKAISFLRGGITSPKGFKAGSIYGGIKISRRTDCALLLSESPCTSAGTFTKNSFRSPTVEWCSDILPSSKIRSIIVTSGNANACTGKQGIRDTRRIASLTGNTLAIKPGEVLVGATGIIGQYLPMGNIEKAIPLLGKKIFSHKRDGTSFAEAITTTDTRCKEDAVTVSGKNGAYTIGGCAKGSGMIHPNMATMLSFLTTDVSISQKKLQKILRKVVNATYNTVTVDGDSSTNDMVLICANGISGSAIKTIEDEARFEEALFLLCNRLCEKIAADGEGATKRIQINVSGAKTEGDARLVARAVASSNLVKTAIFGKDPNWGRIVCAVGYSGASVSTRTFSVSLGGTKVFEQDRPVSFSVKSMDRILGKKVVPIDIVIGKGSHRAVAQTCDLTYEYVKINADYHT